MLIKNIALYLFRILKKKVYTCVTKKKIVTGIIKYIIIYVAECPHSVYMAFELLSIPIYYYTYSIIKSSGN